MKQFSLEEYLKNPDRKVVTRNGNSVRIICTDRNANYPIVGLVKGYNGLERIESFNIDGKYSSDSSLKEKDLFFVPEKHEGWVNVCRYNNGITSDGKIYNSIKDAMENANDYFVSTCKIKWEE